MVQVKISDNLMCGFEGTQFGPVAQLVRAPPCHGGGREFESLLGRYVGSQLSWESICLTSRGSQVRALQVPFFRIYAERLVYADMAQLAEQLICNQQVIGSSPIIGFLFLRVNFISRGGAVWKLVGLITRRSQVQILSPLLCLDSSVGRAED